MGTESTQGSWPKFLASLLGLAIGLVLFGVLLYSAIFGWMPRTVGIEITFLFGAIAFVITRQAMRRVIPTVRIARIGQQTEGKVIRTEMLKGGRYPFPVVQFIGSDGHRVHYLDRGSYRGLQQTGDTVVVRYDPKNPQGSATILEPQAAWRQLLSVTIGFMVFGAIAIVGVLLIIGVLHPSWLGSVRR